MTQPVPPPMISILRDSHDCVAFLRSQALGALRPTTPMAQLIGLFHDKQAAVEAITALNSTGDTNGNL
jgi:hypothetical protein